MSTKNSVLRGVNRNHFLSAFFGFCSRTKPLMEYNIHVLRLLVNCTDIINNWMSMVTQGRRNDLYTSQSDYGLSDIFD